MDTFGWAELVALLTSIGFGTVSAVVPIVNAEAYVIASQVSAVAGPIPIAIGIAIGQTVGKLLLFFGVREGKELRFVKHRREIRQQRPVGPTRARFRAAIAKLLDLVGQRRLGHVEAVGRAAEVALFGDRDERSEVAEFHDCAILSHSRLNLTTYSS